MASTARDENRKRDHPDSFTTATVLSRVWPPSRASDATKFEKIASAARAKNGSCGCLAKKGVTRGSERKCRKRTRYHQDSNASIGKKKHKPGEITIFFRWDLTVDSISVAHS